jgi:hypothetical protein
MRGRLAASGHRREQRADCNRRAFMALASTAHHADARRVRDRTTGLRRPDASAGGRASPAWHMRCYPFITTRTRGDGEMAVTMIETSRSGGDAGDARAMRP